MPNNTHTYVQRELFLRSFFNVPLNAEMIDLLVERMSDRVYAPGDILFNEGEPPGEIFFISEGTVELSTAEESPWVFSGQSFLGALDAVIEERHARTAKALTKVSASIMGYDEYTRIVEDFFDFTKSSMLRTVQNIYTRALQLAPHDIFPKSHPEVGWTAEYSYLDEVQRILILRETDPLRHASVQSLVLLAQQTIEERYNPGEVLFTAGEKNLGVSVVADGVVSFHNREPPITSSAGPGWPMLWLNSISPAPYTLSARAQTNVVVLRIPHEDMYDAMEEHFSLVRSWWKYIASEQKRVLTSLGRLSPEVNL